MPRPVAEVVAVLMGCQGDDVPKMGELLGTKLVLNEFVAFSTLTTQYKPGMENGMSPHAFVLASFALGPRKWVVVGILQSAGSTFDSEVWAKYSLISQLFGKATYTTCVLRTADPAAARSLAEDLSKNYKKPA